jgi:hypothetical protein
MEADPASLWKASPTVCIHRFGVHFALRYLETFERKFIAPQFMFLTQNVLATWRNFSFHKSHSYQRSQEKLYIYIYIYIYITNLTKLYDKNSQGDQKFKQPISDKLYLSNNKLHCNQKRKIMLIKCLKCSPHSAMQAFIFYLKLDMKPGEDFLCHRNGSPHEILSICLVQENREMYP